MFDIKYQIGKFKTNVFIRGAGPAAIVSGALAERIKLWPFLIFTIILTALIYPIQASWKWGGGFLDGMGFLDFAGSTVVHSVGGWAALTGAIILGPRIGKYAKDGKVIPIPGSNLAIATLGVFILWMGWFGFNGGSQLAMGSVGDVADISRIFSNTNAAAAGGAIAALLLTQFLYKKPDLTMVLNGALAGLATGSPIQVQIAFKPPSSIPQTQMTLNVKTNKQEPLTVKGRHDPVLAPRAVAVVEAMAVLVISDLMIRGGFMDE